MQSFLVSHQDEITQLAQRVGLARRRCRQASLAVLCRPASLDFFPERWTRRSATFSLSTIQSRPQREFLENVLNDLNQMLAHFIRAQLTLAALTLIVYSAFLDDREFPNPVLLGTPGRRAGVHSGDRAARRGGRSSSVVALLLGYPHWLVLIIFLGIWRLIQDYVSSPRIMGESMELHPLAAIFGVMAGGEVAGILGVYLSIPVMASLRIVFRRWRLYAEKKKFGPLSEYPFRGQETHRT